MVIEILKAIFFGIVEGITEWLPISSTGHMILLNEFVKLQVSDEFYKLFEVVIQLGAILAVILLFFHKLNPFSPSKSAPQKRNTWRLWFKVVLAVIPSAVIGLPLDDWMDAHFYNYVVVAITLIVYGIAFLFVERENSHRRAYANSVYDIDLKTAMLIGCFQCLSLIPGTSRSGSTILGAIILGVGRAAGAEFSFFLAIPTMLGASVLKLVKFLLSGVSATGAEWAILAVGCVVSFVVSLLVIKGLMEYVRKHSFAVFGVYRIILGVLVLGYFGGPHGHTALIVVKLAGIDLLEFPADGRAFNDLPQAGRDDVVLHLDTLAGAEVVDPPEPVLHTGEQHDAPPLLHQVRPGERTVPPRRLPQHGVHIGQDAVHPVPAAEAVGLRPELCGGHPQGGDEGVVLHIGGAEGLVKVVQKGHDGLLLHG